MNYSNIKVLLTEGACRQTLPIAKAFRTLGCHVTTLNAAALDVGNTSRYPNKRIIGCCTDSDVPGTKEAIETILQSEKYDLVVPMSDFTASLLAENKEQFSQYAHIAINDWEIFSLAFDKLKTMAICMEKGIPCPRTILNIHSSEDLEKIIYPVVIKPRSACGSIGFNIAENRKVLDGLMKNGSKNLGPLFIQEYIPQTGKQFNAHLFLDNSHEVKTALVTEKCRWFPVDGGASTLCVTVHRPDIIEMCSHLLKEMQWVGYCDVDLILDPRDNRPKVIEVNARISANVKICYLVGMNIAKQLLENTFGETVTGYGNYKEDIRLRYFHTDLLWFIKSKNRFRSNPSWFSMKNTADQIFSIGDPLPWCGFTLQGILKYRKEMKKRERKKS